MVSDESEKYIRRIRQLTLVLTLVLFLMPLSQTTQAVPNGGYAHPEIIIQPEELKVLIEKRNPNIRIIDVREKLQYLNGHIAGAVEIWRPDIEDKNHPIPGMMAPQQQIEELLGNLGINNKSIIVIYSDGPDNGRLWWVLALQVPGIAVRRPADPPRGDRRCRTGGVGRRDLRESIHRRHDSKRR